MINFNSDGPSNNEWEDRGDVAWNEFDWERYLREQDESIARYQKLYEACPDSADRIDSVAEQMGWKLPDAILYPTGGGTGLIGMWKAFEELETMGFIGPKRPRMYAVQAEGCAPIVKAFSEGAEEAPMWPNAQTHAHGLRVPKALGDFLILRAVRQSHGAALAVSEAEIIAGVKDGASAEGVFLCPEGGACVAALRKLKASGHVSPDDTVVLFNTGTGFKYVDNMAPLW